MITTNINTTPPNYEEEINSFYLTQLDRTYDEGVVLTKSSSIGCRPLAFAIKAGTKILINGISLEIYSDAAQSAVEFFITATTLTESINKGSKITIDKENLFLQYQRKTEGQVAGFDIDADGISKGGVEITGWLDSDTMEGATANNVATAESVKAYVDASSGGTTPTLQEVTDAGNTTTNSATFGAYVFAERFRTTVAGAANFAAIYMNNDSNSGFFQPSSDTIGFTTAGSEKMRITSAGNVGIGTTSPGSLLHLESASPKIKFTDTTTNASSYIDADSGYGSISIMADHSNTASNSQINLMVDGTSKMVVKHTGNVGIGTTSPTEKLHVVGDALITGGLKVNAENIDFTGLSTSDPTVTGRLWNDRGVLKISAG